MDRTAYIPAGPIYKTKELARILGTTPGALAMRRLRGQPPRWIRVGNKVLYDWQDVQEWLERNKVNLGE
jgi:hypothetical protein